MGHRWPFTGVKRPLPRKLRKKKSEKGSSPPRGRESSEQESKMTVFQVSFGFLGLIFDSCTTFYLAVFDPGAESPWQLLFGLILGEFSRERLDSLSHDYYLVGMAAPNKIFSHTCPAKFPANTLPAPLHLPLLGEPPPLLPPLSVAPDSAFPSPEQRKKKSLYTKCSPRLLRSNLDN